MQQFDLVDDEPPFGERPGLVETDGVDPGQAFDGGQFLHQDVAAPQADHADGEGDRGQQDQSLGDHRHQAGDARGGWPP